MLQYRSYIATYGNGVSCARKRYCTNTNNNLQLTADVSNKSFLQLLQSSYWRDDSRCLGSGFNAVHQASRAKAQSEKCKNRKVEKYFSTHLVLFALFGTSRTVRLFTAFCTFRAFRGVLHLSTTFFAVLVLFALYFFAALATFPLKPLSGDEHILH